MSRPPQIPIEKLNANNKSVAQMEADVAKLLKRGMGLHQQGRLAEADMIYQQVLAKRPRNFDALYLSGLIAAQTKNLALAVQFFGKAIDVNPNNPAPYYNRGISLQELKRLEEAVFSYEGAIAINPNYAEAHYNRGNALKDLKRLEEAVASYERAIALKPDFAGAHNNRGLTLTDLERVGEAIPSFDRAISINPNFVEAHYNRGVALKNLGQLEEAVASYERAIALKPDFADAHNNLGLMYLELGRLAEALFRFDEAIVQTADCAEATFNRGVALQRLRRPQDALASYNQAIAAKPNFAEALNNRGVVLQELKRGVEALDSYDRSIALRPSYAEAYSNLGNLLQELRRTEEALTRYGKAIAIEPGLAEAHYSRGTVLHELGRSDEALQSYEKAIELKPDYEYLQGLHLHTKMFICDWRDFEKNLDSLLLKINDGKKSSPCLAVLALTDSLSIQLRNSKIWTDDKHPLNPSLGPISKSTRQEKIKIGYYSADFRNHAIAHLVAEMLERHDKNVFEIYAFKLHPGSPDEISERIFAAVTKAIDLSDKSDRSAAQLSRDLKIDIAIDLGGHTTYSRTGIFAHCCAPVQVNYLGFPGTLGATYYDYVIADATVIPSDQRQHYVERVVYLPHCYQPNDSKRKISERIWSRNECGLPERGFVFCCFNNAYKILPETFDGWMRILHAVEESVLWLLDCHPLATRNLQREAQARGIDANRLIFATRMPLEDHLARHRLADLFIDTLPYNAHTTASDALWAGLPVLTCMGKSFAARVAGSLLLTMGLPELITHTQADFESKAIEYAKDPVALQKIKLKLLDNLPTSPLFNAQLFTQHIEQAYRAMHARYQSGMPPEHFAVEA